MSRGDRGRHYSALAGVVCLIAFLLAMVTAGAIGNLKGIESERHNASPHQHAESAKARARRACVGREPGAMFECVQEEVERADETAHAEQDLTAQQYMALWAGLLLLISAITTSIGVAGLWFIRETLRETRETAKVARRGNKIMRSNAQRQLRAYLAVERLEITNVYPGFIAGWITVINQGQTPAKIRKVARRSWVGPPTQLDPHREGPELESYYHMRDLLSQGVPDRIRFAHKHATEIASIDGRTREFYVYGKIEYEDVFEKPQWLEFAFCNDGGAISMTTTFLPTVCGNDGS